MPLKFDGRTIEESIQCRLDAHGASMMDDGESIRGVIGSSSGDAQCSGFAFAETPTLV